MKILFLRVERDLTVFQDGEVVNPVRATASLDDNPVSAGGDFQSSGDIADKGLVEPDFSAGGFVQDDGTERFGGWRERNCLLESRRGGELFGERHGVGVEAVKNFEEIGGA